LTLTATSSTVTLSANATASGTPTLTAVVTGSDLTFTGTTASGSTSVTGLSSTQGLYLGQYVFGAGIASGTTITAISGTTLTLSTAATASGTPTLFASFNNTAPLSFSGTTTSGSPTVTFLTPITGLSVGAYLFGAGIPGGTTVTALGSSTITLSANATASGTATLSSNPIDTFPISFSSPTTVTITSPSGENLTSVTTVTLTSPTNETLTIGQSSITMSLPALATGSTTALIILEDPLDVAPGDPGSPSAAAAGPAISSASSPPVYVGFFNTAGQANGNGSVPPGFAFTRTFGQVLTVLYAYNSSSAQDYEGGFYPVGVSGNINAIT
jgi:hypothetical protein